MCNKVSFVAPHREGAGEGREGATVVFLMSQKPIFLKESRIGLLVEAIHSR
jgi:hypothetical protein